MAKIHLDNQQNQSSSYQAAILEDDQFDEDEIQQFQPNSLPMMSEGYGRSCAEKNIMIKILAMGFDKYYSEEILKSIVDEDFETLDENVILNKVITAIFIINNYQNEDQTQQIKHRQELIDMLGTMSPNLMSYHS